ncbi:MAG: hypothetical protein HC887_01195 [Desulfobacteraceae bacterium]|nr:hypothetical protein [Desulfobacteraceae bacterium]
MLRGGSWNDSAHGCRAANRFITLSVAGSATSGSGLCALNKVLNQDVGCLNRDFQD